METGQPGSEQPKETRKFYFAVSYEYGEVTSTGHGRNIVVLLDVNSDCNFLASVVLESLQEAIHRLKTENACKVTRHERVTKEPVLSHPDLSPSPVFQNDGE